MNAWLGVFSDLVINTVKEQALCKTTMYLRVLILFSLLTSPLLASPTDANPSRPSSPLRIPNLPSSSRTSENEAYSEWMCFTQKYSYRPLRTVYFIDCDEALQTVEKADKVTAPMMFGRKEGYIVPHPINVRTCSILIDINDKTADKTVTIPMKIITTAIRLILANCVNSGPPPGLGLGGFTEIHSPDGSGGILDVVVVGKYSPPDDPPPFPVGSIPNVLYRPGK